MEVLEGVANILPIVELSAEIVSLCVRYSLAVKHAKADIERLGEEVNNAKNLLRSVQRLLQGPDKTQLSTSNRLHDALEDCFSQLAQLNTKLDPGKTRKTMSRFGVRALKWPFESKGVEKVIDDLARCQQRISLALQVDQTEIILSIHQKIDLAKLPSAKGAAFDSYLNEHDARCLPNTRVDLRRQIVEWAEDAQSRCIFWLNGMAGTGKSTISHTVAQSFADKGELGGSFFFKRGEGDRGNAARFFTTIAAQLATKVPTLSSFIGGAIDADPAISEKALKEQFEKLILKPLFGIQRVSSQLRLVIVIDALDECEREEDIKTILLLLSQLWDVASICLRIFITSRPELPIRLGFKNMEGSIYQDLVLHEISQATIEHDISAFLQHELTKIRVDRSLALDWPGKENIKTLVEMAVPLFIFAATVCRFVGDPRWDPKKRLATFLDYPASEASKFDRTYLPILDQLLAGLDEVEAEKLVSEFREVVGTIVVLATPLSIVSLASLLVIPEDDVACRLDLLQSVLSIPTNQTHPVRLLHLSFRDFLLDDRKCGKSPFWVDERKTHKGIAIKCLQRMSMCLKKDICNLKRPGTLRSEIDSRSINDHLPTEVQYACRYWVNHLEQSNCGIYDNDEIHVFLKVHFLHWLEGLSLTGKIFESIAMIKSLQGFLESAKSTELSVFLHDAHQFILANHQIIELAPLQTYCSALIFSPSKCTVRQYFQNEIPLWIETKPIVPEKWDSLQQTLEGHLLPVGSVAFSRDGCSIASGSHDQTVRIWDAATGVLQQTLEHSGAVLSVAFSPDGHYIVSGSGLEVRLWDAVTGMLQQTLAGHSNYVTSVAFSPNGCSIISGSMDNIIRMWSPTTGSLKQILVGHLNCVNSVAFSQDGCFIVSGSDDHTVRIWDTAMGGLQQTLKGHLEPVSSVSFSPDGHSLVSGSFDQTVRVWDAVTGELQQILTHSTWVNSVAFSPDGRRLISGGGDGRLCIWDVETAALQQTLEGHSTLVNSVAFSQDGCLVVSGSGDLTVRIWDAATGVQQQSLRSHSGGIKSVTFSPDGRFILSGSNDMSVRIWDAATGLLKQTLIGHLDGVTSVAFSSDGCSIVSGSLDKTLRIWDTTTGVLQRTLKGHSVGVVSVAFASDGCSIASVSFDGTVRIWDATTGVLQQTLKEDWSNVTTVAFSPDDHSIVSGSQIGRVRIWDAATGALQRTLESGPHWINSVAFSPDASCILFGTLRNVVHVWDLATGAEQQRIKGHADSVRSIASFSRGSFTSLNVQGRWITLSGLKVIFLPENRQANSLAIYQDRLVIGSASGILSLYQFELGREHCI